MKRYFAIMPDPNLTFAGISVGGILLALNVIRSIKQEVRDAVLDSPDYRAKTKAIADDAAKDKASKSDLEAVKVRVRSLEGKRGEDLTETKNFRREAIQ